jgi:hypothetical protein
VLDLGAGMKSGHNQFMTEGAQDGKTVADVWRGAFAWLGARLLLAFMFLIPFVLGCFVGGVALHDPDTCWLLSLGRYIFDHRALPATDPFSYSFALSPGKPFVMYQWLSELLFYCAYRLNGLPSLLAFAALLLGQAFLVFPLRLASRYTPTCLAALLTILGVFASCFHFLVRPEIISYVFMSLSLMLLRRIYSAKNSDAVQWTTVAALAALMLIWANAHSAFVLGLVLQVILLVVNSLQSLWCKSDFSGSRKTAVLALIASTSATFINPYGPGLWEYLPGLFFARFNHRIAELRPIQLSDLNEFTYYPFIFLLLASSWIIVRAAVRAKRSGQQIRWANVVVIAICAFYGFKARRIIPFSVLMIIAQVSELWNREPHSTPVAIPGVTPSGIPGVTPSGIPGVTPSGIPGVTPSGIPGVTPSGIPGVTPAAMPGVTPSAIPGVTPAAMPDATSGATQDAMAAATSGATQNAMPDQTSSATPDTTPISTGESVDGKSFWSDFSRKFSDIFNPSTAVWPATVAVLTLVGCFFTFGKVVAPTIPQGSKVFVPPTKVIEFLKSGKPPGNLFNDAQFGDMLIWYAPEIPVFIDTRYDMYGEQAAVDYVAMMSATGDWQSLLDRHKIDWVFVPASAPIVKRLEADSRWSVVFAADNAIVMKRAPR